MAENTADAFYMASDAGQLTEIYNDINKKIDIETDSVPVVLGQITSGLVPIADARDAVANALYGDWLFAGISTVAAVPVVGDVTKTGSKIGKFILKNIDNAPKIADILTFMAKNFPDITKELAKSDEFVDAAKQLSKTDTSKLTKSETEAINDASLTNFY